MPPYRLRHSGAASLWGFAISLANKDGYQDSILLSGLPIGAPEATLDPAYRLSLG